MGGLGKQGDYTIRLETYVAIEKGIVIFFAPMKSLKIDFYC